MIPVVILFILYISSYCNSYCSYQEELAHKYRAKVKVLQAQVMDPLDPELSTIYKEIDSKPGHNMEENMAYNTVQETMKAEATPA